MRKLIITVTSLLVISLIGCDAAESSSTDEFTLSEAVEGLKGGLIDCAVKSATKLGAENGYYSDELVKVLLPAEAQTVVTEVKNASSFLGYSIDSFIDVDEFETRIIKAMNRAAEKAASDDQTIETIKTAISNLSFESAFELLKGNVPATRAGEEEVEDSPYAATIYLKRQTFDSLKTSFSTIIDSVLDDTSIIGVGLSVNQIWDGFDTGVSQWNNISVLPSSYKVSDPPDDLSDYITTKALNGLFYYIGDFEKTMRENFSALFDAASAIYEAMQWAQEQVDALSDTTGVDVLSELPDYSI